MRQFTHFWAISKPCNREQLRYREGGVNSSENGPQKSQVLLLKFLPGCVRRIWTVFQEWLFHRNLPAPLWCLSVFHVCVEPKSLVSHHCSYKLSWESSSSCDCGERDSENNWDQRDRIVMKKCFKCLDVELTNCYHDNFCC